MSSTKPRYKIVLDIKKKLMGIREEHQVIPNQFIRFGIRLSYDVIYYPNSGEFKVAHSKRKKSPKRHSFDNYINRLPFKKNELDSVKETLDDYFKIIKLSKGSLRARDIIECHNTEIRRYLLEEYGYDKFCEEVSHKVISQWGPNELIRVRFEDGLGEVLTLVRVKDSSTGKYYLLRVPPEMKDCKEAIAWTFNMGKEDYNPIKET